MVGTMGNLSWSNPGRGVDARRQRVVPRFVGVALVVTLGASAAAGCGDDGGGGAAIPEGEVFETRGRLVAADADSGTVAVWDLDIGAEVTRYELAGPAMLERALSRQIAAIVAAQPTAGRIDVIGTGVWVWDHVDHFHVYKDPAALQVDPGLSREAAATSLGASGGWVVARDAATGAVHALLERSIGHLRTDVDRSRAPIWLTHEGAPHEGVAVMAQGRLVASRAEGGLLVRRSGAGAFASDTPLEALCPAPSAAAAIGPRVLVACADDLLALNFDDETEAFVPQRIPFPEATDAPSWLLAEDDLPVFVGDAGGDGLLFIDLAAGSARRIPLEGAATDVAADRDGRWVIVLDEQGVLRTVDPVTGDEHGQVDVVPAGTAAGPLAVGDGFAYVAEPGTGRVHEVDLDGLERTASFDVGFAAGSLEVTGMWPGGEPVVH